MHDVVTAHLDPISTLIPWGSPSPNSESDLVKNKVTSGRYRTHNLTILPPSPSLRWFLVRNKLPGTEQLKSLVGVTSSLLTTCFCPEE